MSIFKQRGIITTIVLILIAILLLSYFGIDLQKAVGQPLLQKNITYTWHVVTVLWTDYVYNPITHLFTKKQTEENKLEKELGI